MANKVTFGISNVHIATLTAPAADATSTPTYGSVTALPGTVHLTYDPESNDYTFAADNSAYFSGTYAGLGYTGDLEVALIPDALLAELLGWVIDENGGISEVSDAIATPFAMGFQVEGDVAGRRTWFYNVKMARPSGDHETVDDNIEVSTQTAPITVLPIDIKGVSVTKYSLERTAANATVYDAFFDAVTFPGTPAA